MRFQSNEASCGQTAAANALRALGKNVTEDQVARRVKLSAVDGDPAAVGGTSETQLMRVFASYRVPVTQVQSCTATLALSAVRGLVLTGRPVCLIVKNNTHWVTVIGLLGTGFLVADGAGEEIVMYRTEQELADLWAASGDPPTFYGLAAGRGR